MTNITRYETTSIVGSNLNPLEDVLFWIRGLRSKGLSKDILKEKHGIRNPRELKKRSDSISEHAETAVNLLEQGFDGPIETSFLPLYYGLLNLAKIYIICSNQFPRLATNRWHGASIKPHRGRERDFMKDIVILKSKGTIPLLYKCLTNEALNQDNKIMLSEIYPLILNISHEFNLLYKKDAPLQEVDIKLIRDDKKGHKVSLILRNAVLDKAHNKKFNKILNNFKKVKDNTFEISSNLTTYEEAKNNILTQINRSLIYEQIVPLNHMATFVPISGKRIMFPEEMPILLAFFHLSNIVRYNPELLFELKDSPDWGMIQALSRHGAFRFMVLFWSYIQQTSFAIHSN